MTRNKTKRMQYRLYHRLLDKGPQTSEELLLWYNNDRPQLGNHSKGQQYGSTIRAVAGCMRSSILFEKAGGAPKEWVARPLHLVVQRAILSKKQITTFPHFLQKAIRDELGEGEE